MCGSECGTHTEHKAAKYAMIKFFSLALRSGENNKLELLLITPGGFLSSLMSSSCRQLSISDLSTIIMMPPLAWLLLLMMFKGLRGDGWSASLRRSVGNLSERESLYWTRLRAFERGSQSIHSLAARRVVRGTGEKPAEETTERPVVVALGCRLI